MKCRTCGTKAVVNMRQHKLALCKEHYLEWLPQQVDRFIKKYQMFSEFDRLLLAVSGGKDSLALWDILVELGYQVDGIYINLGIGSDNGYSDISLKKIEEFTDTRNLKLHVFSLYKEYGETIINISQRTNRGKKRTCSVCGLAKRHVLNMVARKHQYDVLVTGHNLDDEAATLFGNTLHWAEEFLLRQAPVLKAYGGFVRKVKPLCRFYEKEMAAYAILKGIEYIYDECPFSVGSTSIYYKQQLNLLEHNNPGEKLRFYIHFLKAKENGLFSPIDTIQQSLYDCSECGQPTSSTDLCSFCKMMTH
ncbi:ATP-binding protein [Chloroflexota bacterium]